jgi:hypothetical protein
MVNAHDIKEHMDVIGADGVHVGTVDDIEGDRIKLTKTHAGAHGEHHHFISLGLVAGIEGDAVRLSANADVAIMFEEEGTEEAGHDNEDLDDADTERMDDDDDDAAANAAEDMDASEDDDDEDVHENQAPSREIPERR